MTVAPKLGQLLVQKKLLTESQLQEAIQEQGRTSRPLGAILIERGWLSSEQMLEVMAQQYGMPFRRLHDAVIDRAVVEKVPLKVALHYKVMPLALHDSKLTVAMSDPQDIRIVDDLRLALQQRYNIEPVLATEEDIVNAMRRYYGLGAETIDQLVTQRTNGTQAPIAEDAVEDIEQLASDASVVKLVNQLILEAHTRRASDIHLEPYRGKVRLRYRIDGLLHDVDVPPTIRQLFPAIVSRVKVLSNLNLVERRLPQDGRASIKIGAEKLDLRTSILPTTAGESVVIRILPNQMLLDLKELGYREEHIKELETLIRRPYGLVFVTGPTGSGKTTTLYACLKTINTEERKIITIEDPVEYELEGVAQLHVNPAIGLSFAQGLRSMLRHDPDVMMVGEVRDLETAELAIRIALTGHLVFSTLHTNDAASGVTRLLDMGIDPYLIVSSVTCFMGQRLVRIICEHCKQPVPSEWPQVKTVYRGRGCEACQQTGYHGRRAIYELLMMTESVKELVLSRSSADAIRRRAAEEGMRTMYEDGWARVKEGLTTPDEILRVTQDERSPSA